MYDTIKSRIAQQPEQIIISGRKIRFLMDSQANWPQISKGAKKILWTRIYKFFSFWNVLPKTHLKLIIPQKCFRECAKILAVPMLTNTRCDLVPSTPKGCNTLATALDIPANARKKSFQYLTHCYIHKSYQKIIMRNWENHLCCCFENIIQRMVTVQLKYTKVHIITA